MVRFPAASASGHIANKAAIATTTLKQHESENTSARPLRLPTIFASRTLRRDRGFKELCSHGTVDDRSIDDPDRNLSGRVTRTKVVPSATSPVVWASISLAIETFTPTVFISLRPDRSV